MGGGEGDCPGDLQEEPWLHDEGVRAGPREGPQVEGMNTVRYSANWIDVPLFFIILHQTISRAYHLTVISDLHCIKK